MKKFFILRLSFILLFCPAGYTQTDTIIRVKDFSEKPSCHCDSLWKAPVAAELVQLLEKTTAHNYPVWPGYNLEDATVVLDAGTTAGGDHCLGLWQKGKAVSYAELKNSLIMLTPIYSYYLNYGELDSIPQFPMFHTAKNAPEFRNWMETMKVAAAVYMPVEFKKLPFQIPSIVKIQLAIHEVFHVEVMLKYWYTKTGHWPVWDKQPDRPGVQICYTHNDSARTQIQHELAILADFMEALLDGQKEKVCILGNDYLAARNSRYDKLKGVAVSLDDGSPGDCLTAESLMELEEGLADYASWTVLYNTGMVSRELLIRRYRASQNDHFYLSGNMLMHAVTLMSGESPEEIIRKIVNSPSVEKGSLFHIFQERFLDYCGPG